MHAALAFLLAPLLTPPALAPQDLEIPYTKYELDNGLELIVHEDHSDPLVAVYVYYHVGSAREEPGRSGFAHLFEHMMFQGSANVGDDQHFKLIQEAGGTLNGTTNTDRTMYFEVLPANQLELALWLEADRMGFLLPAMTQEKLDNQREVVKNERRQSYENRPYGLVSEVVARSLYPPDHPYSWTTIGSMADLSAASLEDVTGFFRRWYGPNNATLAVGGDVDPEEVLALVEKWFGSIPRGPEVARPEPRPTHLEQDLRVVLEDRVKLPQLSYTWPTVAMGHEDEAALDLLASVLSANRSAVLDRALTIDEQVASQVSAFHFGSELAGAMTITLQPQPGVHLDELERRMHALLAGLARDGVSEEHLQRIKNGYEAGFVRRLETVGGRTARLAEGNLFWNDPDHLLRELETHLAVTTEDVERVLRSYLVGEPAVIVSVVPEGQLELAASGRTAAQDEAESALARTEQPPAGPTPEFSPPPVWHAQLANGTSVVGTAYTELPLTTFTLSVPAGHLRETPASLGLASLTAEMLNEGTKRLTGIELTEAFDALGASLRVSSDDDEISLSVSVLEKHLPTAVALVEEVVLSPRFAAEDFARVKKDRLTQISVRADSPRTIASDVWDALIYGHDSVAGLPASGTAETVQALDVADVRAFWERNARPAESRLVFVGSYSSEQVGELFGSLAARWSGPTASAAEASFTEPRPRTVEHTTIYLVDKPGAAQSEIRIGHPGVSAFDPKHHDLTILNYVLGGSFSSRINMNLREDKGYTYGARSSFGESRHVAPFTASAGVRTDVTKESVVEFMKELEGIRQGVTGDELEFARQALTQAAGRSFESTRALSGFLNDISEYGLPDDYPARRLERVAAITKDELDALAREYVNPEHMAILVVGDKATVLEGLAELPYGEVVVLDVDGTPLAE